MEHDVDTRSVFYKLRCKSTLTVVCTRHSQDSPRVPIPNGSCINICTSRGTLLDRSPWSFIGSNANGIAFACALGLVHVAGCSNYERSFWIPLSLGFFTWVPWLSPSQVCLVTSSQTPSYKSLVRTLLLRILSYRFHTSYGWLTFWDWFYGTDIEFVKNEVHNDRHIRIHSTKSAKELFPDPVKKSK